MGWQSPKSRNKKKPKTPTASSIASESLPEVSRLGQDPTQNSSPKPKAGGWQTARKNRKSKRVPVPLPNAPDPPTHTQTKPAPASPSTMLPVESPKSKKKRRRKKHKVNKNAKEENSL